MNVPARLPTHNEDRPSRFAGYFSVQPIASTSASALSYVPYVAVSRGLAFIRLLLVARLLGAAGKAEFGLFQPAQELVNWLVPLVLFGLADVGERYASRMQREGRLREWLGHHYMRLLFTGFAALLLMFVASPWIASHIFQLAGGPEHTRGILLVMLCAIVIIALALYQHLAAVLRGVRAYGASAGLELVSAILFLAFSAIAAWRGGAISLMIAYAVSVLLPLAFYALALRRFLSWLPGPTTTSLPTDAPPGFKRFGAWAFVRLLLMMTFSAVSILGVSHLPNPVSNAPTAHDVTADYAMPYRIAQLLSYVAITLWASTYGIAATAWSHGQRRRAHAQLFRVGRFGALLLTLLALAVLLTRGLLASIEWQYADAINNLLPPLLAIFIWYGLLAFCCVYADLHETPGKGAVLWGSAVFVQLFSLVWFAHASPGDAKQAMILACAAGVGFAILVVAPVALWHPFRFSATATPMVILALAPLSLFSPPWAVDGIAIVVMLGAILFLLITGLLFRPIDRRAWRRLRGHAV